jgi:hypothetical protein
MPVIAMAMQIPPEKYERWRQTVSEFSGARSEEFDAARLWGSRSRPQLVTCCDPPLPAVRYDLEAGRSDSCT